MQKSLPDLLVAYGVPGLVSAVVTALGWPVIRALAIRKAEKTVDARFDVELANHKADLDAIAMRSKAAIDATADAARFDYQRQLADFNVYAVRRHDATVAVYKELLNSEEALVNQHLFAKYAMLEGVTDQGLRVTLEAIGVDQIDRDEVVNELSRLNTALEEERAITDRVGDGDTVGVGEIHRIATNVSRQSQLLREVNNLIVDAQWKRIAAARNGASDVFHANALYLSDEVEKAASRALAAVHVLGSAIMFPPDDRPASSGQHAAGLRTAIVELKNTFRKTLPT
jgi:hypothetical protein